MKNIYLKVSNLNGRGNSKNAVIIVNVHNHAIAPVKKYKLYFYVNIYIPIIYF